MRYKQRVTIYHTLSTSFDWRADDIEWPVTTEIGRGLSGVIATTTEVMWLDPASGSLSYRGEPVETLAAGRSFEEVSYLLITGSMPEQDQSAYIDFRDQLRSSRALPTSVVALIRDLEPTTHPTRQLRAGISVGEGTSLATSVLMSLNGFDPEPEDARLLDLLWVLYAAHGIDAPTFTSMVVASCLADPYFNMVAGLSALRGPRQGGASEDVLEQLTALQEPTEAENLVRRILEAGRPVAGFGHRVYRMPDPRVVILRRELAALAKRRGRPEVFEAARAIEVAATAALAPRGVFVNINFYAAPIFALLGAAPALCPCLFAVARTAGIVALVREAMDTIRLVRPLSRYVGPEERRLIVAGNS